MFELYRNFWLEIVQKPEYSIDEVSTFFPRRQRITLLLSNECPIQLYDFFDPIGVKIFVIYLVELLVYHLRFLAHI